ncbi:uncharacterized protein E0L32_001714 [Thyridium curvatum]|uniref:Uncharacterized protein n=1 Tax=Thyridium curvatum TaxID=1093900 RepID=A0A507AGT2_9PEZI|nr:uncharacterized protein E0L32_001485 [Thyridium curvatum]XP_030990965.1 uncharacterized protein E0L32_001714 [Thyridium curvatum]TPX09025.1 hypothetical protein E0L32_001485 [Thyridium curvatum]TPX09254.1 hypothetical protein E0L32_001714 [Thyridium curvatum]
MTTLAPTPTLPALDRALEVQSFRKSRELYNTLRDDCDQPPVDGKHIQNLAAIFVRHNAQNVLGVHLIHGHFSIPEDTVLLGTNFEGIKGRWARVTQVGNIDPTAVHGHIFVYGREGLCAYEYQNGPLPDLSTVGQGFLGESMYELILDEGTVMLQEGAIKNCEPTRVTGWRFEAGPGGPRVCQANETHAKMTSGNHKIFNAGKPHPKLDNVDDLKAALVGAGVL